MRSWHEKSCRLKISSFLPPPKNGRSRTRRFQSSDFSLPCLGRGTRLVSLKQQLVRDRFPEPSRQMRRQDLNVQLSPGHQKDLETQDSFQKQSYQSVHLCLSFKPTPKRFFVKTRKAQSYCQLKVCWNVRHSWQEFIINCKDVSRPNFKSTSKEQHLLFWEWFIFQMKWINTQMCVTALEDQHNSPTTHTNPYSRISRRDRIRTPFLHTITTGQDCSLLSCKT